MDVPIIQVNNAFLEELIQISRVSTRKRTPTPLHPDNYAGPQALINPIQPGSYMIPHRHNNDEIWVPLRGRIKLCLFDEVGNPLEGIILSKEDVVYHLVNSNTYHSAFALDSDSVFLNVNPGPFNPKSAKEFPQWAPKENADLELVRAYLAKLENLFK